MVISHYILKWAQALLGMEINLLPSFYVNISDILLGGDHKLFLIFVKHTKVGFFVEGVLESIHGFFVFLGVVVLENFMLRKEY